MSLNPKKIFFGWWTVIAGGIIGFLGIGFFSLGFSVFFKPLAAELVLTRTITSIAPSMQMAMGGIMGPLGGAISDKYGPRLVMLIGVIALLIGSILMFFVNSLWSFLLVWGIFIGGGFSLGVTIMTDRAIINWFVRKSGIAINTKFAIQSLSGLLLLPAIAFFTENMGWRLTLVFSGIILAVVAIPLICFFIKPHRPEHYGMLPDGDKIQEQGLNASDMISVQEENSSANDLTVKEATRTSAFWMLFLMNFSFSLVYPLMGAHAIPFLTDNNIDVVQAASILGLLQSTSIPSRILTGLVVDKIKLNRWRYLMVAGYVLSIIGTITYILSGSIASIYFWFAIFGIGMGITQSVSLPLQARYFGRKSFGSISGLSAAISMPAMLGGPILVGWIFDANGSYSFVIYLMAAILAASGIMACFIMPPKKSSGAAVQELSVNQPDSPA